MLRLELKEPVSFNLSHISHATNTESVVLTDLFKQLKTLSIFQIL